MDRIVLIERLKNNNSVTFRTANDKTFHYIFHADEDAITLFYGHGEHSKRTVSVPDLCNAKDLIEAGFSAKGLKNVGFSVSNYLYSLLNSKPFL